MYANALAKDVNTARDASPQPQSLTYEEYIKPTVLRSLQDCISDSEDEMAFIVVTQITELFFSLLVHEWSLAKTAFLSGRLDHAQRCLRRSLNALKSLLASWEPIARLSPHEFGALRKSFQTASGADSHAYREMEVLLGKRNAFLAAKFQKEPPHGSKFSEFYDSPSLYDAALLCLAEQGFAVPDEVLHRDFTRQHEPSEQIAKLWAHIYSFPQDHALFRIAEQLTDIAEAFRQWNFHHIAITLRLIGEKVGSAGTSGVQYLINAARDPLFPEIWEARTHV
ncbi:tryptophan 2,3-dioxygenase [Mycobacterium sp.]|uniref:tryptophan 2,3-dioxygenase n=1 Tax=Mycobacterium sp. TaxID=1785 RepID=UPI003BA8A607